MSDLAKKIEAFITDTYEDLEFSEDGKHVEGSIPLATTRTVSKYDWDALNAARKAYLEAHPELERYQAVGQDDYPTVNDFLYPEPKVETEQSFIEGWNDLSYALEAAGAYGVDLPGIGRLVLVDQYGGEGQGDEYWFVFKVGPILTLQEQVDVSKGRAFEPEYRHFKVDGYYASYSGGTYDEIYEVFPKQVLRTEWSNSNG